jgi:hypothetical protein
MSSLKLFSYGKSRLNSGAEILQQICLSDLAPCAAHGRQPKIGAASALWCIKSSGEAATLAHPRFTPALQ